MTKQPHPAGYFQQPTICGDTIVFVSEDTLWSVQLDGGFARSLTQGPGKASHPRLSPDGEHIAYTATEAGHAEIYAMDALGGPSTRLTHHGKASRALGWDPQGRVVHCTNAAQPFRPTWAHAVDPATGHVEALGLGPVTALDYKPVGEDGQHAVILTRYQDDPARWKRYRGGRAGQMWIDADGDGQFKPLLHNLGSNIARAMWCGDRVVFLSDHEGIANLYACQPDGQGIERLTPHDSFYARMAQTDGQRVVYQHAGDLWVWDPQGGARQLEFECRSPRAGRRRRFVDTGRYLSDWDLHDKHKEVAISSRGRAFTMGLWSGPVTSHHVDDTARYRLLRYVPGTDDMLALCDRGGEEAFELWSPGQAPRRYDGLDMGRVVRARVSPSGKKVALSNHRFELMVLDLDDGQLTHIDQGVYERINGFDWSPDSAWLVYSTPIHNYCAVLRLAEIATGAVHDVTHPEFQDLRPTFDPKGRYLYFVSVREFDPVYDTPQFSLGFPRAMRLCMVLLQADEPDPFVPRDREESSDDDKKKKDKKDKKDKGPEPVKIDLEGIGERVLQLPVTEARLGRIIATEKHVYYTVFGIEGGLNRRRWTNPEPAAKATLRALDLKTRETQDVAYRITDFGLSRDHKQIIYRAGRKLRVMGADGSNNKKGKDSGFGEKSGWINLRRVKVSIDPGAEWTQMAFELRRLMLQHYWRPDMDGVDWNGAFEKYVPLLERIGTRSEFSDLAWEIQAEMGASHAYEMGGDHTPAPPALYRGQLGADLSPCEGGERIDAIVRGDNWNTKHGSPLGRPGTNAQVGDVIVAVDGMSVGQGSSVASLLVNKANTWVRLTLQRPGQDETHDINVRTHGDDTKARYRQWVNRCRQRVHEASDGQLGYIHIPDMGANGFAEFHRGWLQELTKPSLILDVRYNGGGHVSQLLIEKVTRRRLGYLNTRWRKQSRPYPIGAKEGPIVGITNEHAGSDGDIFSHIFKLAGLGPLIGKRTWGGTIGISPRHYLVDGTVTTQPEFSHWFNEVGYGLENHGTEVDIEVDIAPHEHKAGQDPQLERAIEVALERLEDNPVTVPDGVEF